VRAISSTRPLMRAKSLNPLAAPYYPASDTCRAVEPTCDDPPPPLHLTELPSELFAIATRGLTLCDIARLARTSRALATAVSLALRD